MNLKLSALARGGGLLLSLLIMVTFSGCTSSDSASDAGKVTSALSEIESILPQCKFESIEIPNGILKESSPNYWPAWLIGNTLHKRDLVFELDSNGEEDYSKPSIGDRYFNKNGDKYYACHSLGKSVRDLNSYEDVIGSNLQTGDFCWTPNRDLVKENLRRLKACEERVERISKLGFWVVVRQAEDSASLKEEILSIAQENLKYGYSISPLLVSDGTAITLQANFDQVNEAAIGNIELVWQKIIELTKFAALSDLLPGYPDQFNLDNFSGHQVDRGDRKDISDGYQRVASYQACSGDLKTSELNYSIGDCGQLNFEIFQADLKTGPCAFLGYWKDSQGNQRIGVVTFCEVFNKGSFVEGNNYKIGVRINGVTSYITRMGYENSVLSFTAVR